MENKINKRIVEIEQSMKELKEEKDTIQSECLHKETIIKFAPNTSTPKLYCTDCKIDLGYPDKDSLDNFLK